MDSLSDILNTFRLQVEIFHNAQYCGDWALDTSGSGYVSFHMVTHGDCVVRSESLEGSESLSAGDLVVFPHDSAHLVESSENCRIAVNSQQSKDYSEGLEADSVGLLCGYFKFAQPGNNPILQSLPPVMIRKCEKTEDGDRTAAMLGFMKDEAIQRPTGSQGVINRLTESLFILLVREFLANHEQKQGLAAALADPRISKALDAIHANAEQAWTVEELASVAAMSRSAFAEQFKSLLGESPMAYLARWRMQNAWTWLSEDGISVLEAAQRTGYESEASFSKAFKKVLGQTPGQVRKGVN